MTSRQYTQIGRTITSNVSKTLLSGMRPSSSANHLAMMTRGVSGGNVHKIVHRTDSLTFMCNVNMCEDTSVCGD